ncbi:MAG: hypothetical protein Q4C74_06875 [Rothia sp. (in: high G+C Gram-positive bacteria)]|nr:hypothetical protein [Rothia sp. (in: high G+C Gram-positive bacteria)]
MSILKLDESVRVAGRWLKVSSEARFLGHIIKFSLDDNLVYEEKKNFPFEFEEKLPGLQEVTVRMKAGTWGNFELEILENDQCVYRSKGYMLP